MKYYVFIDHNLNQFMITELSTVMFFNLTNVVKIWTYFKNRFQDNNIYKTRSGPLE